MEKKDKIKEMAMKTRAKAFEREQNKALKEHLANRRKNIKAGGFKNEDDYFRNVNPFTGKRRGS